MALTSPSGQEFPGTDREVAAAVQPAAATASRAQRSQVRVVTLPGEIDITNDRQVRYALARALSSAVAVLVADATGTIFCSCSGARALIRVHRQAATNGAQLRVATSPAIRRILELTGTDQVLDTYPTLTAALSGPRQGT